MKNLMGKVRKVVVIGLDAPVATRVYKWAREGELPTFKSLMERGVYAENCLVPYPTITPPNWTTIATGANPGTHGITDFDVYFPSDPLDFTYQAFDTSYCEAEYIWDALEREGKKSILINWPSSWPPTHKEGIQIGGGGVAINEWRIKGPHKFMHVNVQITLADEQLFSTKDYPEVTLISLKKEGNNSLWAELPLRFRRAKFSMKPKSWWLKVESSKGKGYDRIKVFSSPDTKTLLTQISSGEWSPVIREGFQTTQGVKEAAFRMKLVELSPDAKEVTLYVTDLCATEEWGYPPQICREINSEEGIPMAQGGFMSFIPWEWFDKDTFIEVQDIRHVWKKDAAIYLLQNKEWDLFMMHIHTPDFMYHRFFNRLDPRFSSPEEIKYFTEAELGIYKSIDRRIGEVLSILDEETLVIIISDHGFGPAGDKEVPVEEILQEAGLLVKDKEGRVDWRKTKAYPQRYCHIYVNLKGRNPGGIVEPSDYEKVREEILKALTSFVDPRTGKKAVALALRREDARIIGLYGEKVGDVVYALREGEYVEGHGPVLPTVQDKIGGQRGLLIMCGPGVKKGVSLKRNVHLADIVPTLCFLADFPLPRQAEGGIIYQALEGF